MSLYSRHFRSFKAVAMINFMMSVSNSVIGSIKRQDRKLLLVHLDFNMDVHNDKGPKMTDLLHSCANNDCQEDAIFIMTRNLFQYPIRFLIYGLTKSRSREIDELNYCITLWCDWRLSGKKKTPGKYQLGRKIGPQLNRGPNIWNAWNWSGYQMYKLSPKYSLNRSQHKH